jgi:hypothetical protein
MRRACLALVAAASLAVPAPAAQPPESELVYDLRALAMVLPGNWYPVDAAGRPKPKSTFTLGIEACAGDRTATLGSDLSIRRAGNGLEISIGVGFQPAQPGRHGEGKAQGLKLNNHIIYLMTPAPDGSPRLWVRDGEDDFDNVYHKCPDPAGA